MTYAWRTLTQLPHAEVECRLAYDRLDHDRADAIVLERLRRAR